MLIYYISSQPTRLTKVLSLMCENLSVAGIRNLFLFGGLVALVPQYYKGYHVNKTPCIAYCYLPRRVGSLLVWYLWLVRPYGKLITAFQPPELWGSLYYRVCSVYLWSNALGRRYKDSRVHGEEVKKCTARLMGVEGLNVSLLRHLLIAFGWRLDGKPELRAGQALTAVEVQMLCKEEYNKDWEMQAGHSPTTALAVYAKEAQHVFTANYWANASMRVLRKWHKYLYF
jgi:hypothetical protein